VIRRYTLAPPLAPLPGDTFTVAAGVLEQRRDGSLVAFRTLAEMESSAVPAGGATFGGNMVNMAYIEESVMARTATCANVILPASGTVNVGFGDAGALGFADRDAVNTMIAAFLTDDLAQKLLIAAWVARDPAMTDPSWIIGKTLQLAIDLDLGQLQIGVV
jgi:hypothetical protein